jgi:hypothetical protein
LISFLRSLSLRYRLIHRPTTSSLNN